MPTQNKSEDKQTEGSDGTNIVNTITPEIKSNIQKLYARINRYFTSNIYFEHTKKPNLNPLAEKLFSYDLANKEIIEAGLSPGTLTLEACLKKAKASGIDSSPLKVVVAENLKHIEYDKYSLILSYDDLGLPVENLHDCKFRVMNINDLEFKDNSLDIVISDGGIKQGEISQILTEFKRVLKPDGFLLLKFELNDNLKILINDPKKGAVEVEVNHNNLQTWALSNQMKISYSNIIYKLSLANILTKLNPKLAKFPLVIKFENEVIIELRKE